MRIIGRKEFIALPPPVLYSKIYANSIDTDDLEIKIRNGTSGNDWYAITLNASTCIEVNDSNEHVDEMFKALKDPTYNLPVNFYTSCRDGLFETEEEAKFAVLDIKDIASLLHIVAKLVPKEVVQAVLDTYEQGYE